MSAPKAYLSHISYYLPEQRLTNEHLHHAFPEWSVHKIMDKVGIAERRIAASDEFVSDLATKAAQQLFTEHHIAPESIDYLLLCTQSPDYFLPTTACLVHQRLQLRSDAGALDFNQGCSGFIYGLSLAKGLIASGEAGNVLLITAETYSKFLHPDDKSNRSIFGDAAAATLITGQPGKGNQEIKKIVVGTNGSGAANLIVKNGAARSPRNNDTALREDENGNVYNDNHLFMNGSEIFNFTLAAVPPLVEETLRKNDLQPNDISLYIFHQANRFMLEYLRKKIKIAPEKFFIWMEQCGNTVSSTIPIALKHAREAQAIRPNDQLLLAGFGVGYSWGAAVLSA